MQVELKTCCKILTWVIFLVCALLLSQANGATAAHELGPIAEQSVGYDVGSHRCDGHPIDPHEPSHRCEHSARLGNFAKSRSRTDSDPDQSISAILVSAVRGPEAGAFEVHWSRGCKRDSSARAPFWSVFARTCSLLN